MKIVVRYIPFIQQTWTAYCSVPGTGLRTGHTEMNKEHTGWWERLTCIQITGMLIRGFSESTYLSQAPRGEGVMSEGEKGPGTLS